MSIGNAAKMSVIAMVGSTPARATDVVQWWRIVNPLPT
jgi:hypothetical protein